MPLGEKMLRLQLSLLHPILENLNTDTVRSAQEKIGALMSRMHRGKVDSSALQFDNFTAEWVIPKTLTRSGVILYLHGGGFVTGDIEYAKGGGSMLAANNGMRVFCVAYRLAPEHPFPAALDDAFEAYKYLLDEGFAADEILLCGESAGGGLCFSLALRLRDAGLPLPKGIIAMSPWTDLTFSGESMENNKDDPSLSRHTLEYYASAYVTNEHSAAPFDHPLVSPLFADLHTLPPSLIFAGGSEMLLSDAVRIHEKLLDAGCSSELVVAPDMWHVYLLYGIKAADDGHERIGQFIEKLLSSAV